MLMPVNERTGDIWYLHKIGRRSPTGEGPKRNVLDADLRNDGPGKR